MTVPNLVVRHRAGEKWQIWRFWSTIIFSSPMRCPTFPFSVLELQMKWRGIAAGLVQHGLCGAKPPHESYTLNCPDVNMKSLADEFLALKPDQRRVVHFVLCEYALHKWNQYASVQGRIRYTESVVGTQQQVDKHLPADALGSARQGTDSGHLGKRYEEPITAMQDDDLIFPENIEFAYYAIYNLFRKYALGKDIDDWLIVNQALSSEEDSEKWDTLVSSAIQRAIKPVRGMS